MCLITGSVCHIAARRYQWLRRISPQKCSISVSSAGAGSNSKRTACSSSSVGTSSRRERRRYSISTSECFCSSKNQTLMNAQKSLSSRLSRRNISVAGSADHSVIAFILMVVACSSVSCDASKESQGMSLSMSQRTASSCLNSSGYSMLTSVSWPHFKRYQTWLVRQNAEDTERVSPGARNSPSKMRSIGRSTGIASPAGDGLIDLYEPVHHADSGNPQSPQGHRADAGPDLHGLRQP